jgi:hypothetical protein
LPASQLSPKQQPPTQPLDLTTPPCAKRTYANMTAPAVKERARKVARCALVSMGLAVIFVTGCWTAANLCS